MVLQGETTGPYRGPDRRGRNDGALAPVAPSRVVTAALLVVLGAGSPALFLIPRHPGSATVGAYGAVAAALLFIVAGGLRLVAWKMAGRAVQGWLGSAFVALGLLLFVTDGLSSVGVAPLPQVKPADQLLTTAIAAWLVWRGTTDREVNAGLRPLVMLCWAAAAGLFLMGALNAAQINGLVPHWLTGTPASVSLNLGAAAVWTTVGIAGRRTIGARSPEASPWGLAVVGFLALGCALHAVSGGGWTATVGSAAFLYMAAAVGAGASICRLQELLRSGDRVQRTLQLALTQSLHQAATARQDLEEWLHDVRNAVAGLQAADAVLRDGFQEGLDGAPELADAVTAELARLHSLVDPARQLHITAVDLASTIQPLAAAERALGTDIRVHLSGGRALADRGALARVLQNVLTNARLYAPGAPVVVTAGQIGDRVEIVVHDRGPGIPPEERTAAFERGRRGTTSAGVPGNGLGLYVARTLMAGMGGELRLDAAGGPGCRVLLSLPAAEPWRHQPEPATRWSQLSPDLQTA